MSELKYKENQKIDSFTLTQSIGVRTGCEAWRAVNPDNKELVLRIIKDPEIQIIVREQAEFLESLTQVESTNSILGVVEANPFFEPPYIVEPWVGGYRTLQTILREVSPLPQHNVLACFRGILRNVEQLHQDEITHGALSPENILVNNAGQVLLCGMGWGRIVTTILRRGHLIPEHEDPERTIYFAPEQVSSANGFDLPADIYSLGVLLYEMSTGKLPEKTDDGELKTDSLEGMFDEYGELMEKVLKTCLLNDPKQRAEEFNALRGDIDDALKVYVSEDSYPLPGQTSEDGETANTEHLISPDVHEVPAGKAVYSVPTPLPKDALKTDEVETQPLWMSTSPVSALQFGIFLRQVDEKLVNDYILCDDYCTLQCVDDIFGPRRGLGNYPINCVSQLGAEAYCEWLSKELDHPFRLPTWAEWLVASGVATDGDGPWPGGESNPPSTDKATVGRHWNSFSGDHVLDQPEENNDGDLHLVVGGVAEWTSTTLPEIATQEAISDSERKSEPSFPVDDDKVLVKGIGRTADPIDFYAIVTGGSWADKPELSSPRRGRLMPKKFRRPTIGFRVVTDKLPTFDKSATNPGVG
jgi:formylglycine-generating enzyme required for sulfatase activity